MAQPFYTKITKARFVRSPFTGREMAEIGETVLQTIFQRWDRGLDANDAPAPPLSERRVIIQDVVFAGGGDLVGITSPRVSSDRGYRRYKQQRTGRSLRDLHLTGRLRRSIKVLTANENRVVLGPLPGMHTRLKRGGILSFADVLRINNRRSLMWALSPQDRKVIVQLFLRQRPIRAERLKVA
jgi:hypothetical protein